MGIGGKKMDGMCGSYERSIIKWNWNSQFVKIWLLLLEAIFYCSETNFWGWRISEVKNLNKIGNEKLHI